jgi:L-ascorbate metabolism protein UlaG (beta-lactamase superfamily)
VLSTQAAAKRLKNGVVGLKEWESYRLSPELSVIATPARHGPLFSLPIVGKVLGFILKWETPTLLKTIYISGDTVLFKGISHIAERFSIDIAILHAGGVRFPFLTGPLRYTLNGKDFIKAALLLKAKQVIPIHYEGWSHFREPSEVLHNTLKHSEIADRLLCLEKGVPYSLY